MLNDSNEIYQSNAENNVAAKWTSPEVLLKGSYSFASEVWSFGVVMWEIYSFGGVPYYGMTNQDLITKFSKSEQVLLSKPKKCPDDIYAMMKQCWKVDVNERITIETICDFLSKKNEYNNPTVVYHDDPSMINHDPTVYN